MKKNFENNNEKGKNEKIERSFSQRAVKLVAPLVVAGNLNTMEAQNIPEEGHLIAVNNIQNVNNRNKEEEIRNDLNNYFASAEDLKNYPVEKENLELETKKDISHLDVTNFFVTNKAEINESNKKEIIESVYNFLNSLTREKAKEAIDLDWQVFGSSDERPTHSWGERGNEALTQARLDSVASAVKQALGNFDFSKLVEDGSLSQYQANCLKNKFINTVPYQSTTGPERGVKYLTDLINPDTGDNYSRKELNIIKKEDPKKYEEMLNSCRYVGINFTVEREESIKGKVFFTGDSVENKKIKVNLLEEINDYNETTIIFDNSKSMKNTKTYVANQIVDLVDLRSKINVGTFCVDLNKKSIKNFDNNQSAAAKYINTKIVYSLLDRLSGSVEHTCTSLIQALEKTKNKEDGKKWLVAVTDEAIQDLSISNIEKLEELAKEKNTDITFMMALDKENRIVKVSLEEMKLNFIKQLEKIEKIKLEKNLARISIKERRIVFYENALERAIIRKEKTKLRMSYSSLKGAYNNLRNIGNYKFMIEANEEAIRILEGENEKIYTFQKYLVFFKQGKVAGEDKFKGNELLRSVKNQQYSLPKITFMANGNLEMPIIE